MKVFMFYERIYFMIKPPLWLHRLIRKVHLNRLYKAGKYRGVTVDQALCLPNHSYVVPRETTSQDPSVNPKQVD